MWPLKRRSCPWFVLPLVAAALLLFGGCGDSATEVEPRGSDTPTSTNPPDTGIATSPPSLTPGVIGGGGGPPLYESPVLIVPGEYRLPYDPSGANARYEQALAEDATRAHFSGTINGFRVYDDRDAFNDPVLYQKECVAVAFEEVKLLDFGYLPPGTYALSPQYAARCEDGSTAWVLQEFTTLYDIFAISYELGEKAVGTPYSAQYVRPVTVATHGGVAIGPLTEEGAGGSILALDFASGFLILHTSALPFYELEKMAEGVTCAGC